MPDLIAIILTKNEARHIAACIRSVEWADQVLLSDSFSDDGTVEIARALGADVFQTPFVNFAAQRNLSLEEARRRNARWVFFIDADERATPELAAEIHRAIQSTDVVGWWVPRYNYIMGHRMRGGGWYPDAQLRLMRPEHARYDPTRHVHEIVLLDGPEGTLREHLIHYNYDTLQQFHAKQSRYLLFEAQVLREHGIRPKPWSPFSMLIREFWRRYVQLQGYRDGWVGLLLCTLMGWYTFRTYRVLQHLQREDR